MRKEDLFSYLGGKVQERCAWALIFVRPKPYISTLCGNNAGAVKVHFGVFFLPKSVQRFYFLPVFQNTLLPPAGINGFHHAGIGVPQQIRYQSTAHTLLL